MSTLKSVLLADRGVVRVRGVDALSLLQGLITNDMALLDSQDAIHGGLLSPQGKVLFDFFVVRHGDSYLLETARANAHELVQRLLMYKLRADVSIEDVSRDYTVAAVWGGHAPDLQGDSDAVRFTDPRHSDMGQRILVTLACDWLPGELPAKASTHDDFDAHRISNGVPEGGKDFMFGEAFVHEALFDQLNGVSFSKGCYVGQEVVSRMQHRGTARRRIVPIIGASALPSRGSEIRSGSSLIGILGSVQGLQGLATLRLDRLDEAMGAGHALVADGVEVSVELPPWARFSPGSSGSSGPQGNLDQ